MIHIAGGIVINPDLGVVVVSQNNDSWSLPKGHVEVGEEKFEAALREIEEETGIPKSHLTSLGLLGTYTRNRIGRTPDDPPEAREITLYLFKTEQKILAPVDPENPEARWVPIEAVAQLLTHEKDKAFFEHIRIKTKNFTHNT